MPRRGATKEKDKKKDITPPSLDDDDREARAEALLMGRQGTSQRGGLGDLMVVTGLEGRDGSWPSHSLGWGLRPFVARPWTVPTLDRSFSIKPGKASLPDASGAPTSRSQLLPQPMAPTPMVGDA